MTKAELSLIIYGLETNKDLINEDKAGLTFGNYKGEELDLDEIIDNLKDDLMEMGN